MPGRVDREAAVLDDPRGPHEQRLPLRRVEELAEGLGEFGGEPIPDDLLRDVRRFLGAGLPAPLQELLEPAEREALLERAAGVLEHGRFPVDTTGARYPWPLV